MKKNSIRLLILTYIFFCNYANLLAQKNKVSLKNDKINLVWTNMPNGWQLRKLSLKKDNTWIEVEHPSGENTLLYSAEKPSEKPDQVFKTITGIDFLEKNYHYQTKQYAESTSPVALNTAGKALYFYPKNATKVNTNKIVFSQETALGILTTEWMLDPKFPTDILVKQSFETNISGYFSFASPTLATTTEDNLEWATVPGYFQGNKIQPNVPLGYAYGHGVPDLPIVFRDRTTSTLCPIITAKNGITFSVIPDPNLGRDPWETNENTLKNWGVGLSHKNRKSELTPTLYYPVLGEKSSELKTGQSISYDFRYSFTDKGWFKALNHAVYDIFQFKETLPLRKSKQSLTNRIQQMHHYLTDAKTSFWNIEDYKGLKIGAQSYRGGVIGSQKDAMKNADYAAMWMLANATKDTALLNGVLPYALNFKMVQQITDEGFFKGALAGQYYLAKQKRFTEEWGEVVEPIATTYYTMLDLGNILLFEPQNNPLKERLKLGAEALMKWQKPDGSWAVAYDKVSQKELFQDVKDLRPTFYGLLVAYRILKNSQYLTAAQKGANWLIDNAVKTGSYLGVCGDARYAPDFATAQTAQALLDLYDITQDNRYKTAAIEAAKMYCSSIYTHPIPTNKVKIVNGVELQDWEITQSGLSFEHGGILGSANTVGPILLCSHAGLFIRMYQLTNERIFADMARAGAWGRDAFVDAKTSVASYYWSKMNNGPGQFPHHAWWQIGWLTDYLMAEAELRSGGKVKFPRGFVTPKVGPHQSYGFEMGMINGQKATLIINEELVKINNPSIDCILAESEKKDKIFVILLNNQTEDADFEIIIKNKPAMNKHLSGIGIEILTIEK